MSTSDTLRRRHILRLIETCRHRTGWPVKPLEEELQAVWNNPDKG